MPELPHGSLPVPGTPIGDLTRWRLSIRCGRCKRQTILSLDHLVTVYGDRVTIGDVVRRLRCSSFRGEGRCRARPTRAELQETYTYGKTMTIVRKLSVVEAFPQHIPVRGG
jgi:hypothetical protein